MLVISYVLENGRKGGIDPSNTFEMEVAFFGGPISMVLSLTRLVVSFALDLVNINLLLLDVHPLILRKHVAIQLFCDFVSGDVVNLIGVAGNA